MLCFYFFVCLFFLLCVFDSDIDYLIDFECSQVLRFLEFNQLRHFLRLTTSISILNKIWLSGVTVISSLTLLLHRNFFHTSYGWKLLR